MCLLYPLWLLLNHYSNMFSGINAFLNNSRATWHLWKKMAFLMTWKGKTRSCLATSTRSMTGTESTYNPPHAQGCAHSITRQTAACPQMGTGRHWFISSYYLCSWWRWLVQRKYRWAEEESDLLHAGWSRVPAWGCWAWLPGVQPGPDLGFFVNWVSPCEALRTPCAESKPR